MHTVQASHQPWRSASPDQRRASVDFTARVAATHLYAPQLGASLTSRLAAQLAFLGGQVLLAVAAACLPPRHKIVGKLADGVSLPL